MKGHRLMKDTDKDICRWMAAALAAAGVRHAVLSPGSRNAPMLLAMSHRRDIDTVTVVDERSAAFIALGLALQTGSPVAAVCTSGSAVLNYAPAVAEACYRHVPLVVVSADRPAWLIDADEPQTIRQAGVLGNIVKHSCDIAVGEPSSFSHRKVAETLLAATSGTPGPVHINLQIDEPLGNIIDTEPLRLDTDILADSCHVMPTDSVAVCATRAAVMARSARRLLVVAGHMQPDPVAAEAVARLAALPQTAVLAEPQSNLPASVITNADAVLATGWTPPTPDMAVHIGGSLVSGRLRRYLRECGVPVLKLDAASLAAVACNAVQAAGTDYGEVWRRRSRQAALAVREIAGQCPWSDLKAMSAICGMIPESWNVHLSNGTTVRYASLFGLKAARVECNRGVSGIEGSTSTAIGASMAYDGVTLLITGDMSAQIDMGALAAPCIPPRFKMIVLNNCGGGIFRCIPQTAGQPECESLFAADVRLPLANLCRGFGLTYHEADSPETLAEALRALAADNDTPAVLNVLTPPDVSARAYRACHESLASTPYNISSTQATDT